MQWRHNGDDMTPKLPNPKKCKICHQTFQPSRMIQPVCDSYECKVAYAEAHANRAKTNRMKLERKKTREAKERSKPLAKWLSEAQEWMNRWVREVRDKNEPCISCGRYADSYDAGHYRSRGSASHLRFNEDNLWKQCSRPCNHDLSGNIVNYRLALVKKIGLARVEALECNNEVKKWTIEEAKAIKEHYKALIKLKGE